MGPQTRARGRHAALRAEPLARTPINKLRGNAFGGGIGMGSVCDVAIGVVTLKMALTEARLGILSAINRPYVVARIGEGRARRSGYDVDCGAG
ncbi:enoyl-CoA hydratase-related protein [uncultured Sulfitobacter sp.]|uniref:enoyl-CoA hydratase-related protein n=1 Tax=uncultured Sulfitobacter sp. TaxID=191468 RepID=UPI00344C87AF